MNDLAGFSEWTLALLPRLFLYPGGLWLLITILGMRFIIDGRQAIRPGSLIVILSRVGLPSMATAWAAVALLPLPGAVSLTFPTDRLALAGLLAVSLAFDGYSAPKDEGRTTTGHRSLVTGHFTELAIFISVLAPLAAQTTLIDVRSGIPGWISLFAVFLGVAALSPQAASSLSLAVRLIGWLGLASAPLWMLPRLENPVRGALVYMILMLTAAIVGRLAVGRIKAEWSMAVVWSLAALSLLAALLLPA